MSKVLLVEDTDDVRATLSGGLRDAGHTVQAVATANDALNVIVRESFDHALIDVRLNGDAADDESGLSLATAFRVFNPKGRIIIVSGYLSSAHKKTSRGLNVLRYLGPVYVFDKSADINERVLERINATDDEIENDTLSIDETRLCASLMVGQPVVIRAYGTFVRSVRTWKVLRTDIERYARRVEIARESPGNMRFQVKEIGKDLWREILQEHEEFSEAYIAASTSKPRIPLLFESPREYLRLPLEFMFSATRGEYLVLQHPLSRLIMNAPSQRDAISPHWLASGKPLRILLIAASTKPTISGVDLETAALYEFFNRQPYLNIEPTLIRSEEATLGKIERELQRNKHDVIHYAGHGWYDPTSPEESALVLWADSSRQNTVNVTANRLKIWLEQSEVRLVYLSCCQGTETAPSTALQDDDFLGIADAIIQAGVPTVLGFRWPVSDQGAKELATDFYESLFKQGSPEIALWNARRKFAMRDYNNPTWLSPILIHQA